MRKLAPTRYRSRTTAVLLLFLSALALLGAQQTSAAQAAQTDACVNAPCAAPYRLYLPVMNDWRPVPETLFGVQMYGVMDTPSAALETARAGNVSWVRTQISWRRVEPVNLPPEQYDFAPYDTSIRAAVVKGIRPIVTFNDNPGWAATFANGPIDKTDLEEFGRFVGAAVERYDGDGFKDAPGSPVVRYWEFYNEPDSGDELRAAYGQPFWGDYGAEYAEMLCVSAWYAHNASPEAQVVMGGVAHDWFRVDGGPFVETFVDDVLKAGGGKCIDVMNFHYYPVFASRWQQYGDGMIGKTEYFRRKLASYGLTKPFMCTEVGWHSDPQNQMPSSLQKQAEFAVQVFAQSRAANLLSSIWWTWIDPDATVGSYGLLTQSLGPKPSYHAFKYASSRFGAAPLTRILTDAELGHPALEGYLFGGAAPVHLLWSNDSAVRAVEVPGRQAVTLDIYGNLVSTTSDEQDGRADGRVTLSIGPTPVYVEVAR